MKGMLVLIGLVAVLSMDATALCVCWVDETCYDEVECDDGAHCSSTTFTVPSAGNYILRVLTKCSGGGSCGNCFSCATIYKEPSHVWQINVHTGSCNENDCDDQGIIALAPGYTYSLYVCKELCTWGGGQDCEDCPETCKASACVYEAGSITCNP